MTVNTFIATTGQGIARASCGADGNWTVDSPLPDYDVRCLAVDPIRPQVVYAGTHEMGVLRSEDQGKSWQPVGLTGSAIRSIAVSRSEPGTVYVGTKPPMLFVSRNSGENWTELTSFREVRRWFWFSPAEPPFTAYVQSIALSPTNPNVIVVGIEAGAVVRSEDGGRTWQGHRPGAVRDCHSMTFHSNDENWVYESGGTGVAFSRDAGRTWKQPRLGLDRRYGWACAADPERPEVWYASLSPLFVDGKPGPPAAHVDGKANAYIFRSIGGAPWEKLAGGLPQPLNYMAYALLTDPTAPGHLYSGMSNGEVWHSQNYGDTWHQLPFSLNAIQRTMVITS